MIPKRNEMERNGTEWNEFSEELVWYFPFHSVSIRYGRYSVSFCSIRNFSVSFRSVSINCFLCSVPFRSISFRPVSIKFYICSVSFRSVSFQWTFFFAPFHSNRFLCLFVPFHSVLFHFVSFFSVRFILSVSYRCVWSDPFYKVISSIRFIPFDLIRFL